MKFAAYIAGVMAFAGSVYGDYDRSVGFTHTSSNPRDTYTAVNNEAGQDYDYSNGNDWDPAIHESWSWLPWCSWSCCPYPPDGQNFRR